MKVKVLIVYLLAFFGIIIQTTFSKERELVTAYSDDPPNYIVHSDGRIEGILTEILSEFAERLGLILKTIDCPWKRCLHWMKHGEIDIMAGLLRRKEREEYMFFIDPPYKEKSEKCFYVLKGQSKLIRKYEDLYDLSVGVAENVKYFKRFDEDSKIDKLPVLDEMLLHKMLKKERFDTFVNTCFTADFHIIKMGNQSIIEKAHYQYSKQIPVYAAISKKSSYSKQLPKFKQVMKKMVAEGTVDRIINGYFDRLRQAEKKK